MKNKLNLWWPLLVGIGLSWIIPMLGAKRMGEPLWFFLVFACLWFISSFAIVPLYDVGIKVRRKIGLKRLADWGERVKPQILPPLRCMLMVMAIISLVVGIIKL